MESNMTYGYKSLAGKSFARIVLGCFMMMVMTIATTYNVQGQTLLSEELRDGTTPMGWTATDVAFTTSASGYANFDGGTGLLTSPSIDLSGITSATLTFNVAQFGSGTEGPLEVEVSIDGGTTWTAQTYTSPTPTSSTYLEGEVDLNGTVLGESDVMIRFNAVNSPSNKRLRDVLLVGPNGVSLDPAIDVANIAELRNQDPDGVTRYRLTGEALIAFYDSFNDRRYLVDATAGIFSEDPGNLPDSLNNVGDGITGLEGTMSLVNNGALLRFNPDQGNDSISVTTGNTVNPETIRLSELSLNDTGKLVKVPGVTFKETGNFSTGTNYTLYDGLGDSLTFRTDFFNADYIGEAIPTENLDITGLVGGFGSSPQIFARSSAGFEVVGDTVDVTFTVNMATAQDTISSNYEVSINGYFKSNGDQTFASGETTSWDADATAQLTNIGGDYWQGTFKMVQGDTLHYKYRYNLTDVSGRDEAGILPASVSNPDGNDLRFVIASSDISTPVEYFNTVGDATLEDTNPFNLEDADNDSVGVYFRVNVGAQVQNGSFDPETDSIEVRGSVAPLTFDATTGGKLSKEDGGTGDNLFYSGVVYFDRGNIATGTETTEGGALIPGSFRYKFYADTESGTINWESGDDRVEVINSTTPDTTFQYKFFDRTPPSQAPIVQTTLSFEVNVGILEGLGLFNSSIDTVSVRGTFNGFGEERMDFNQVLGTYEVNNIEYTKAEGSEEKYKYYIKWDSRRDSSESEFFLEGITHDQSGWEEPGVTGGADRTFTIENKPNQDKLSEFYNGVEPEALLTTDNVDGGAISVTFSIDMSPATNPDLPTPFVPASDSVFLFVDTPFFALTNNITVPGDNGENFITQSQAEIDRMMFTDEDGDMVYELELDLTLPTLNHIGFRIAYGEPTSADGQLVANGGGFDAGRRHYQYIQPQVDDNMNVTWPSTFSFPELTWKQSDLPFETPPDYQTVGTEDLANVENFRLNQNYPNPFNPSTTISFNLPNAADVNLTVYNILGQRVATLLNKKAFTSGSHTLSFDASHLASGIYIYRLEAGAFTSQKRMTLIK